MYLHGDIAILAHLAILSHLVHKPRHIKVYASFPVLTSNVYFSPKEATKSFRAQIQIGTLFT